MNIIFKNPTKLSTPKLVAICLWVSAVCYLLRDLISFVSAGYVVAKMIISLCLYIGGAVLVSLPLYKEQVNQYVPIGFACIAIDELIYFPSRIVNILCSLVYIILALACIAYTMAFKMDKLAQYRDKLKEYFSLIAYGWIFYVVVRLLLVAFTSNMNVLYWCHLTGYILAVAFLLTWILYPDGLPKSALQLPKSMQSKTQPAQNPSAPVQDGSYSAPHTSSTTTATPFIPAAFATPAKAESSTTAPAAPTTDYAAPETTTSAVDTTASAPTASSSNTSSGNSNTFRDSFKK